MKHIAVVFILSAILNVSCSGFYNAVGRDSILSSEAGLKIDEAVLIGMTSIIATRNGTTSTSTSANSGSLFSLAYISSTAGIDEEDTKALYEKKKVEACADSILSTIVLTQNTDSGLIAASACKLKKLP
ncbi:TIGR04452 family lipoprotein [Leptospira yasudae]|uniref:TIGR04452 family lipoprotein n=1 Tax=Leptospira yasudae TaxID=2202201 RepID=A0A6N4QLG9_9LEPT|nr:TIGR04452 family lipoprotein [Leptospira yasudae]TGL76384.1 TIGR04452 family lipoprotein [Leptospira yasudae]TGL83307.1 TIGR04452 family lipoprotein [Leptospira yasudae]TGL83777.1 TIGR04452 family lipoprotein [Leptospira yasudae]